MFPQWKPDGVDRAREKDRTACHASFKSENEWEADDQKIEMENTVGEEATTIAFHCASET